MKTIVLTQKSLEMQEAGRKLGAHAHTPEGNSKHAIRPLLGHRVVLAIQLAQRDGLGVDGPHLDLRSQP